MRKYIKTYMYKSVTYENFVDVFESEIRGFYDEEKLKEIRGKLQWEDWVKKPGAPLMKFDFSKLIFIVNS